MCAPSAPAVPAQVTPAPAPAPAAPAATPAVIGQARQQQNIATGGTIDGPSTRVDRNAGSNTNSAGLAAGGASGLNI